jgi:GNAT superfamily N-acetyltransferase
VSTELGAEWIGQALHLSEEAGWNQNEADWGIFFAHGTVLGVVDGRNLAATAAVLPYGDKFGWISMVLVTRAWRGRGIATRLVDACIKLLRDAGRAALLDATPAGEVVYRKLGFVPLLAMRRFLGSGRAMDDCGGKVNLTEEKSAFGADRRFLLKNFLARPGSLAFPAAEGFAILRQGAAAMQVGPVVDSIAPALAAIDAARGPVLIDVLQAGYALIPLLDVRGFREQRRFTRMALGTPTPPGNPARLLCAAGPEFG